jgi:hypothetical protein
MNTRIYGSRHTIQIGRWAMKKSRRIGGIVPALLLEE